MPELRNHLGRFLFSGDDIQSRVGSLSGGEQARVALAKITLQRANLLLLDEPTNHLDLESREVLEEAIEGYQGTVILISHDRAFLSGTATRVWAWTDGRFEDYPGGFDDWQAWSARRKEASAPAPAAPRPSPMPRGDAPREARALQERAAPPPDRARAAGGAHPRHRGAHGRDRGRPRRPRPLRLRRRHRHPPRPHRRARHPRRRAGAGLRSVGADGRGAVGGVAFVRLRRYNGGFTFFGRPYLTRPDGEQIRKAGGETARGDSDANFTFSDLAVHTSCILDSLSESMAVITCTAVRSYQE